MCSGGPCELFNFRPLELILSTGLTVDEHKGGRCVWLLCTVPGGEWLSGWFDGLNGVLRGCFSSG